MDLKTLRDISAITDPVERARAISRAMTEQQGLTEEAARIRRGAIAEAREDGLSLEEISKALGVTPGRVSQMRKGPTAKSPDEIIARRKMMTANDVPVRIATSYFRADLFGGTRIAEPEFVTPSLQAAVVALGYAFGHAEETLTSRPATRFEAETLELEPGEWVVQVLRASYSTEGTPIHTLETICSATVTSSPSVRWAGSTSSDAARAPSR